MNKKCSPSRTFIQAEERNLSYATCVCDVSLNLLRNDDLLRVRRRYSEIGSTEARMMVAMPRTMRSNVSVCILVLAMGVSGRTVRLVREEHDSPYMV